MCCDKETFEEVKEGRVGLTRRQALKVMGSVAGALSLTGLSGCTSLLGESGSPGTGSTSAIGVFGSAVRARKPDQREVQISQAQIKEAFKAFHQGEEWHAVSLARQALERLFRSFDSTGFTEVLQQKARSSLKAFKDLDRGELETLHSWGATKTETNELQSLMTRARSRLLTEPNLTVRALMEKVISHLRQLEAETKDGTTNNNNIVLNTAPGNVEGQGLFGCIGSALVAVGTIVVCVDVCGGTAGLGCYGYGLVAMGTVYLTADSCGW